MENADTEGEYDDHETEDSIMARALDEAALEGGSRGSWSGPTIDPESRLSNHLTETEGVSNRLAEDEGDGGSDMTYNWPAAPSSLPLEVEETDEETKNKLDLLMRLNAVSGIPTRNAKDVPGKAVGKGYNIPGFDDGRDEDTDSWCCESAC